jgi:PAS domain S-box-containing protein
MAELLATPGAKATTQYRLRHKDGTWHWVEGTGTNLLHDPSVRAIVVNYRDITEQRRAAEALRESEQRFARFMQHLPGLAWAKDVQGRYVYANDAAERAFRAPRAALYGKTDDDVFPPGTAAQFKENDRRALASESGVQVVETLEQEDGVVHHSLVSKFPIPGPDGRPALVGGMAIDITERQRAEDALAESEGRFRQLAENINEVFWLADPQATQVLYVSPAYERVWGRPCQGLYERPQSFLDAVHPDDRERARAAALEEHSRGEATDVEYRVVRPDGSVRWVRDRGFPIKDAAGRVYRFAGLAEDVTDKKEAEAALRDADRRKDEFLAVLAHELRNPLAPLLNGLQILRQPAAAPQSQAHARDMMERQLRHLARLVDDLLDVSRISRGKVQLRCERIDLARHARTAAEDRRPVLERAGLALVVETPETPVWVTGDPTRLAQIVNNLLDNSAKFSDGGRKVTVRVTAGAARRQAALSVRDEGVGIEPEMLPRLFNVFAQADRSLDRTRGGLGLGLALVKGLAELHGGEVEAFSEGPGKGAEFTVRLPLAEEPAALAPKAEAPRRSGERHRILVVEDSKDAAESLRLLLELLGHEVRVAYTGPQGVAAAKVWRPDIVLCDIGLPGLDGYGVARELRLNPTTARARLLALTGYGQDEDRRRSREAGFDYHLVKPADPEELQRLLATG